MSPRASAEAAVRAALERFGRIDVLVNNAGDFYAGFFEELTPEQIERQVITNLIGPMNATRAVLPVMLKQRAGTVVDTIPSVKLPNCRDFWSEVWATGLGHGSSSRV